MPRINAVRFRRLPWGPELPWRWLPRLARGGQFGPGAFHGRGRQEWLFSWGWWRVECYLW